MVLAGCALLCSFAPCVRVGAGRASVCDGCVWGRSAEPGVGALLGVVRGTLLWSFSGVLDLVVLWFAVAATMSRLPWVFCLAAWDFCIFSFRLGLAREPWFLCDFSA